MTAVRATGAAGRSRFLFAPIVVALLLSATCGSEPEPAPRPPVVVISIDTLRSDRLPAYGYDGVETPAVDRLAADGVVFEHAYAHAPTTLPSHASILTGLLPGEHGARDNGGFTVDESVPTLAGTLAGIGYRTGGFVSAFPIRAATGIARGFDVYDDDFAADPGAGLGEIQRPGAATLARALDWLDEPSEAPPFLFFHLFEPHRPYEPPPPFAARFEPYDGEIAESDRVVGELLDELRERGLYAPALVVLLSDHGESLGEHGEAGHGIFVYRPVIQVPMIVKLPDGARAGDRFSTAVQLVDVVPTVLDLLGLEPPAPLPGRSLVAQLDDPQPRPIYAESYAPQLHFGWSPLVSLVEFPLQYIEAPRPELYHLVEDPDQLDNRVDALPDDARRMAARLATMLDPVTAAPEVDAETRRQLAALGYLGAGGADSGERPDPKDKIGMLDDLRQAAEHFFAGEFQQAVDIYERLLREEPNLDSDAWRFLGQAQTALGRFEEAAVSFEALRGLGAGDTAVDLHLAELYLALRRPEQAAAAAERARTAEPARAATLLARVAARRNDLPAARTLLQEALEANPDAAAAHALLAEVTIAGGGDPEVALGHADRAVAIAGDQPQGRGLRVIRGRILLALDRPEEASGAFIEELRRHPNNLQAYQQLAALHLSAGNHDTGQQVLESMLQANPGPQAELMAIDTLRQLGRPDLAEQWRRRAAARYPDVAALGEGVGP